MNVIRIKNDLLIKGPCCNSSIQKQSTLRYENQGIHSKSLFYLNVHILRIGWREKIKLNLAVFHFPSSSLDNKFGDLKEDWQTFLYLLSYQLGEEQGIRWSLKIWDYFQKIVAYFKLLSLWFWTKPTVWWHLHFTRLELTIGMFFLTSCS